MGGHVAIWFAAAPADPRVRGVAAWNTPLDLAAAQQHLDAPGRALYRRWVLRGLREIYAAVARRHPVPSPPADVARCRTIREWDRLAIAPRYGCASPEAYYRAHSAALALPRLTVETVLVATQHDPVVPPSLVLPWLGHARTGMVRLCVLPRGGHLHVPRGAALGLGGRPRAGVGPVAQLAAHWRTLSP
jgi:predicted alpha/beta-fold hydrolase